MSMPWAWYWGISVTITTIWIRKVYCIAPSNLYAAFMQILVTTLSNLTRYDFILFTLQF